MSGKTTRPIQEPNVTRPGLRPGPGQPLDPPRTLHVVVPHEAWRRARSAALDSGLAFKDYMALLMLSARPLRGQDAGDADPGEVEDQA